jgi:acetyltransferase-like isoleucine patch superfamily enzyme
MAEELRAAKAEILSQGRGHNQTDLQAQLADASRSALRRYQDLAVGSRSWLRLAWYELLTLLVGPLPGALGLLLRQKLYPTLFARVGRNAIFGRSLTLRHPGRIEIGDDVAIDDYAVLDAKGGGDSGIRIGDGVMIGRGAVLSCKGGRIEIGAHANIAMHCLIQAAREVAIGENVLMAAFVYVVGGGDHLSDRTDLPIIAQGQRARGVRVGAGSWIGAGAVLLDGSEVGHDSIVGANAVVRGELPPLCVAAGAPARVLRSRRDPAPGD